MDIMRPHRAIKLGQRFKEGCAMRYVILPVLLTFLFAVPVLADEKADIEAVEQELKLEKEAQDLYTRVIQRAEKAVKSSSLGKLESRIKAKNDRLRMMSEKLAEKLKILSPESERIRVEIGRYRGRHGRISAELVEESKRIQYALEDLIARSETIKKQMAQGLIDYKHVARKIQRITEKMISIFLSEEIEKHKTRNSKGGIGPELERLKKKKKGEII